ncbi:hypothetical protein ZWY2020_025741 [Hordeum vulgare]|nr:hypothetical protein ZWY2020_025741 [Hordeum vulgare]
MGPRPAESHRPRRGSTVRRRLPIGRHGWSTTANQRPSLFILLRRHVLRLTAVPPPKGPNNGRGPQGQEEEAKPPARFLATPPGPGLDRAGDGPVLQPRPSGHLKVACPNHDRYIRKDIATRALCPDRWCPRSDGLWARIEGLAFFHMQILDRCAHALPLAITSLGIGVLEMTEAELNHLYRQWTEGDRDCHRLRDLPALRVMNRTRAI